MKTLLRAHHSWAFTLLRAATPMFLLIHGTTRWLTGGVAGFGDFLSASGMPLGHAAAILITSAEIIGSIALSLGWLVPVLSLYFAAELGVGILLVHYRNGWFVVGGGEGGMEYSMLLIICFIAIFLGSGRPSDCRV